MSDNYWDTPCEAWHSTAEVGSHLWSHEITAHRYFVQPHIPEFADFRRWKGKRVLEIGCGIGTDTMQFERYGAEVHAVESSKISLSIAGKRMKDRENTWLYRRNAEEFLPTGSFDLVYSFGVLHHTTYPESILSKARCRMKQDAELRIMLYAKWSIKHLLGIQPEAKPGCPLVRWYSAREAKRLLESCGFKVVSIRKTHIFPWRIRDYKEHRFVKVWIWRIMPEKLFSWLESKLGHHLLIVARRS